MKCSFALVCFVLVAGFGIENVSGGEITLEMLLEEMVSRDSIAVYPEPGYVCRQFSSYDRDTKVVDGPGWYANWDRSQFVRMEEVEGRQEWVMLDADGPGAIVRFWGTWHGPGGGEFSNGTLRIYIDESPKPVIEGPIADIISGGKFVGAPLSNSVSPKTDYKRRGHNLYFPIPYSKHCKITYSTKVPIDRGGKKGEALYYQINYRTYDKGAKVESLSDDVMKRARGAIARTQKLLANYTRDDIKTRQKSLSGKIAAEGSKSLQIKGGSAISEITINIDAEDIGQALRSTVLEIEFDSEQAVWCPVGDFFGTGYGIHPYRSWYTEVKQNGDMSCFWTMPFKKAAKVTVRNLGGQDVTVNKCDVSYKPWRWQGDSMYFHASWRQYYRIRTGTGKDMTGNSAFDVNYIEIEGKGTYAGDTLTIFNGASTWWGEGDEKIFIDGEDFPSHVGTGTEDYYGYAWCRPEFFEAPFHAQPQGGGNLVSGLSVNSRYRLLDGLCFTKSLKFDMEMWHWAKTKVDYAPTTFWYGLGGATSNVKANPEEAKKKVAKSAEEVFPPKRVKGAIEGEGMKIVEATGGQREIQNGAAFGWSNNRQLWWRHGKVGDRLVLEFEAEEGGKKRLIAALTKARDYGIINLKINSKKVLSSFDLYNNPDVITEEISIGECDLKKGANEMEVVIVGANPDAIKSYMFGVDYLLIK